MATKEEWSSRTKKAVKRLSRAYINKLPLFSGRTFLLAILGKCALSISLINWLDWLRCYRGYWIQAWRNRSASLAIVRSLVRIQVGFIYSKNSCALYHISNSDEEHVRKLVNFFHSSAKNARTIFLCCHTIASSFTTNCSIIITLLRIINKVNCTCV